MKSDWQLQRDVMEELKWEPMLHSSEIAVTAKEGVITLSGYVDTYAKKLAAERAAKRVKEVRAVAEDIEVRIHASVDHSDTAIAAAALKALEWNSAVPDNTITLKVEDGWLYLEGDVDWQYQKEAAYNAVKFLTGVKGVINLLHIKPKSDALILEDNIRKALERSADVEARRINIQTEGSKVILTGSARSWGERNIIEETVWSAPGVLSVEDDLVIEP